MAGDRHIHLHLERFESYDEMGQYVVAEVMKLKDSPDGAVHALSHAVDRDDPEGKPYSLMMVVERKPGQAERA
jgi:hypothetical protein